MRRFEQDILFDYYGQRFSGNNMVFSAAGNLEHDAFVDLVASRFDHIAPANGSLAETEPRTVSKIVLRNKKALEQVQLCLGVPSPPIAHDLPLRDAAAQYRAGRRHELAALPDGA